MEEEKQSIKDLLETIKKQNDELIEKKEEKKFKLPFSARLNKASVKKNYATFCIINDNKAIEFKKIKIDDGTVNVDGVPRIATSSYCLNYNNKPFYIIDKSTLEPFNPVRNAAEAEERKMAGIAGRRLVLAKMEKESIKPTGKGFGMIGWIVLGAVIIGAIYFLSKGGKIF